MAAPKVSHWHTALMSIYRWLVIVTGAFIFGGAVLEQIRLGFDSNLILLAVLTTLVASKVVIKLTRFKGIITVADVFIFFALLQWGMTAAILIAATESIVSTAKIARLVQTYLFNAGVTVTSIWLTAKMLQFSFGVETQQLVFAVSNGKFAVAVGLMGLTYYLVLLSLIAIMQVFKMKAEEWWAWMKQFYLWSCITFFLAAAGAGVTVKFVGNFNLYTVLVIAPIPLLIYFSYQTYLNNLDALQESEARFRSSFDYATVGMALISPQGGCWLQVNQSLCQLLGRQESELINTAYQKVLFEDDAAFVEAEFASLLKGITPTFQKEVRFQRADDSTVWALLSASLTRDAHQAVKHIILQTQDLTLRKKAEEQLLYDASHDALTALHNRASFVAQMQTALRRAKRNKKRKLAVLFLDLDGFKMINDSLGHSAGDELLKITAKRILECVRTVDTVARLGGDEFTILLEELEDVSRALHVAGRIQQKLSEPFHFSGQEVFISTSIGVATSEISYQNSGDLLRDADAAMYQAKARGKNCYVLFDHEMHSNATRLLRLANDLRRAPERGEFVLHYQPMQSLETNEIYGFEALIRWQHPHYGLLMPSEFITLAEENGLSGEIDRWAMLTACRQLREWQREDPDYDGLSMSVNISTKQFAQDGLFAFVKNVLAETGLNPRLLQLEVTESAMVQNLQNTARVLKSLNDLGVGIALDDFGTGYSSLSYLHELPISTLKIDRSFVNRVNDETDGAAIVRAIIVLARNLQIKVIAEGVETLDQLKHLRGMGCEYGQGFLFSRPISAADSLRLLNLSAQNNSQVSNHKRNQLRLVSNI